MLCTTYLVLYRLEGENDPTSVMGRAFRNQLKEVIQAVCSGKLNHKINLAMGLMKMQNAMKIRKNWEIRVCFMTWKSKW